jgi:AsmA protein
VLTAWGLDFRGLEMRVQARDGTFRVDPLKALLYGGRLSTAVTADLAARPASTQADLRMEEVQIGQLLAQIAGKDYLTGRTDLTASLSARGTSARAVLASLSGEAAARLAVGELQGFSLIPEVVRSQVAARNPGLPLAKMAEIQQFKDFSISLTARDGVVRQSDLNIKGTGYAITGKGQVDLSRRLVDYDVVASVAGAPAIPYTVSGEWTNLKTSLDVPAFLAGLAGGAARLPLAAGEGAAKLPGKVLEGMGSGFESLFKGKLKKQPPEPPKDPTDMP